VVEGQRSLRQRLQCWAGRFRSKPPFNPSTASQPPAALAEGMRCPICTARIQQRYCYAMWKLARVEHSLRTLAFDFFIRPATPKA